MLKTRLLSATALVGSVVFAGGAFAQQTPTTDPTATTAPTPVAIQNADATGATSEETVTVTGSPR